MNERIVVKACKEKDLRGQKALHAHFYGLMLALALRYTSDEEEAKDALKDGFLEVFKTIKNFDFEEPLHDWVRNIIILTIVESIRSNKEARLIVSTVHVAMDTETDEVQRELSEEEITAQVKLDLVLKAIHSLIPSYRIVFNLFVLDDYSHSEISNMLKISEDTSVSNLEKATHAFRNSLSEQLTESENG